LENYLAEKVQSLGKDWHRPCLKCEKCGKTLSSGGHAEVVINIFYLVIKTETSLPYFYVSELLQFVF
jgi:exoribonuclease II